MFSVTITDHNGGERTQRSFDKGEVSIGRERGNDVLLLRNNVSKRHARILYNRGSFMVIDNKSTNGTFVNGERIGAPYVLKPDDKIFIGDFVLEVSAASSAAKRTATSKPPRAAPPLEQEEDPPLDTDKTSGPRPAYKSPVDVGWGDDSAVGVVDADVMSEPTNDPDLDFGFPSHPVDMSYGAVLDDEHAGEDLSLAHDEEQDPVGAVLQCLREYVDLDAYYHQRALGGDCECGFCLLCRARYALGGFNEE